MEDYKIRIDPKVLILSKLVNFYKNKSKIEENSGDLYKLTQEYLTALEANPLFLDKPAIIERVKNIIFNNLLLSDNMKITQRGIAAEDIAKDRKTQKIFSVLQDGSIIFFSQNEKEKLTVIFDEMDDQLTCRFLEHRKDDSLKYEKRVIIDKYGFDKRYIEITAVINPEEVNEHFRENFKSIITHVNGLELTAFTDWGNHSITPILDNKFLNSCKSEKINRDELYEENRIQSILFKKEEEILLAFPHKVGEVDEYSIIKIQEAFEYYTERYSGAKTWFINRFGKKFLIDNNMIAQDDDFCEKTLEHKIKDANIDEVLINFQEIEIETNKLFELLENLYQEKSYEKAIIFFKKLSDKQKIQFLSEHLECEIGFLTTCISCFEDDYIKIEFLNNDDFEFSVNNKVAIIASLKDEDEKVELYEEILDEILEHDEEQFSTIEDQEIPPIMFLLSEIVLDSLKDKENIKDFILKFSSFPVVKYEHLQNMSKEDIDYLLDQIGDKLDTDEYVAFLRTNHVDDDDILDILENNWEDELEFSTGEIVELPNDISYPFRVFALLKINDNKKRNRFLDENIEYYSPEEISVVLEMLEDSNQMLTLAKKYDLPEDYYYYLMTLCEDEFKFECLNTDERMDIENFKRVASSITDISAAFDYIIATDKLDIINKMAVINEFNMIFCENPEEIYERKFEFLNKHKKQISALVKTDDDLEIFNIYVSEFWDDSEKMEKIEQEFSTLLEDSGR